MRARSHSADRLSCVTLLLLGAVGGGILICVVTLPLALSSPFPTPRERGEWILDNPPGGASPEAPSDASLADASLAAVEDGADPDRRGVVATLDDGAEEPLTFAERWNLRVPQAPVSGREPIEPDEAALPERLPERAPERLPESRSDNARHDDDGRRDAAPAPAAVPPPVHRAQEPAPARPAVKPPLRQAPKRTVVVDPVERYLWEVYQRKPLKSDSTGDFTWKDQAAAKRLGMTLRAYVIGGMDPDFREQLYHAGHAMDASGLHWSMLSAFRDDYRQGLAAGFKAHGGNSLHGGSRATGGYTHGRAIDIACADDGEPDAIWHWIDAHGAKYGLTRPMRRIDPAHIQARGAYHDLAHDLRDARLRLEAKLNGPATARTTMALRVEK